MTTGMGSRRRVEEDGWTGMAGREILGSGEEEKEWMVWATDGWTGRCHLYL
jgi:hypothetical protein